MWRVIAVIAVLVSPLVLYLPAAASCPAAAPIQENAARAEAVVYGTVIQVSASAVTDVSAGAATVRINHVLKGQFGSTVRVLGIAGLSTIDYRAELGSDHVFYLATRADGQLETNACVGSHAGPPDASEVAFFGLSSRSAAPTPDADSLVLVVGNSSVITPATWAALVFATIVFGIPTLLIVRRRRA